MNGLQCKSCGGFSFRVLRTDVTYGGRLTRRRECNSCAHRFTTMELEIPDDVKKSLRKKHTHKTARSSVPV